VERELPPGRRVAPSILSADYSRLGAEVQEVMDAGARVIHVDVMDGHFVPPITIGPLIVNALREQIHGPDGWIDVHLMIEHPERHVADFVSAGADSISIHWEATPHVHYALKTVREAGLLAGLAINPATPGDAVTAVADNFDILLCMTVNPGWGGQAFLPHSVAKIERARALLGPGPAIEVDGGIDVDTAGPCASAGATAFVAGTAVFGAADPRAAFKEIAAAAER
jgi:ribulose-phosphate 3-epimerase